MSVVKKCINCRVDLAEDSNGATQCPKCQKNEKKYGKATTCQFCQLNAAFHERKCVWCAHSERKFGGPISCANCKLISAFPKSEKARKNNTKVLCRMCVMQAVATKQTTLAGVPVSLDKEREKKEKREVSSSNKEKDKKRRSDRPDEGSSSKAPRLSGGHESMAERENQVKLQRLQDEISRLNAVSQSKDFTLAEKDKQISNLKATMYNNDKKCRERIAQIQKEKEECLEMLEKEKAKNKIKQ